MQNVDDEIEDLRFTPIDCNGVGADYPDCTFQAGEILRVYQDLIICQDADAYPMETLPNGLVHQVWIHPQSPTQPSPMPDWSPDWDALP